MVRDFYDQTHSSVLQDVVKRVFDLTGAGIGMILTGIFFPFIALAILIDSGWPVFYTQERLGLRGEPFKILKFRTMFTDAEADGIVRSASESDSRITRTGNFLCRSHLDELPQFINVLRGNVSLVGPRAERKEIVESFRKRSRFTAAGSSSVRELPAGRRSTTATFPARNRTPSNSNTTCTILSGEVFRSIFRSCSKRSNRFSG